jgi:GR25 family glycosyltransferase involved in LPS biosynthesis
MELPGIGIYFINLDDRKDRLQSFTDQFRTSSLLVTRVPAVSWEDVIPKELFAPPGVVACWMSHQKVYELLIKSENSFAVIFEDDAIINKKLIHWLENIELNNFQGIDLLQLGYLKTNGSLTRVEFDPSPMRALNLDKYIGLRLARVDFIYRSWIRFSRCNALAFLYILVRIRRCLSRSDANRLMNSFSYFSNERKLRERFLISQPIIYHSFEAGTHAYVISRQFAETMLKFNNPVYLPADLCFMGIARAKNFKVLRSSKSMSQQSKSNSSINSRTIL